MNAMTALTRSFEGKVNFPTYQRTRSKKGTCLGPLFGNDADGAATWRKGRQAGDEVADVIAKPGNHHLLCIKCGL